MSESSWTQRTAVVFGIWISLSALIWLLSLRAPQSELPRFGFISALFCAGTAVAYFWAVIFASVIKKRHWPARRSGLASLAFLIPWLVWMLVWSSKRAWSLAMMFAVWGALASLITRKLAYPELTEQQIYAPEVPVTLFPK